jgi:hypothetical protein
VTWACDSTASYRLYVTKNNDNNTDDFYIDGVQCENLAYATTYVDGNQEGCKWNGNEHGSTSERDAQSRIGGRVYSLDDYKFHIDEMPGIGMPPIEHLIQNQPLLPGALLRNIKVGPRIFELVATQIGDTHEDLHSMRKDLLDAIKPDLVLEPQPFVLRYTGANADKTVEVRCVYDSGYQWGNLEGFTERDLPLRFIAYEDPFFKEIGNDAFTLTTTYDATNADYICAKIDYVWQALGTGMNGRVWAIEKSHIDQCIYVGGEFTTAGGVSANYIAKWDGSTWSALGTGMNDNVRSISIAADGSLYAGGDFTTAGGTTVNRIAKWNGSAWSALSSGVDTGRISGDGKVYRTAVARDGTLYVGGDFTNASGTTVNSIASWDGSTWSALGTGVDGSVGKYVYGLALADNGDLYIAGQFTTAGSATGNGVAMWDGTSWNDLGTGVDHAGGKYCQRVAIDNKGVVFVTGVFTEIDSVSANRIASYNGEIWSALGTGLDASTYALEFDNNNLLYVGGSFTEAGGLDLADRLATWNEYTWGHVDINLPGTPQVSAILTDGSDIYLGYDTTGTITTAYTQTVTNNGTRKAFPVISIKRSGGTSATIEWIKNEDTGKVLFFDYALLDGEELVIDLTEGNRSVASSLFGSSWHGILRNSDFSEFYLLPGANNITVFVNEVGSPTITAYMQWRNTHWSADGAAP